MVSAGVRSGTGRALEARVAGRLGSPTLFIDGEPAAPLFFYCEPSLSPESPFVSQAQMARAAGIRLLSFSLPMPWPPPGESKSFDKIDRAFEAALGPVPDALVILRFSVAPPRWWLDAHPGQEMVFSDSAAGIEHVRWGSVASTTWREAYPARLDRFVEYLEARWGGHVLGYHPCNLTTAEWFYKRAWEPVHSGYEEPMRRRFAQWARARYGTEERLRAAWRQPRVTFDSVRVPAAYERERAARGMFCEPALERFAIDFAEFQQDVVVEVMEAIARQIKVLTENRKLVAYFYGYYFELGGIPKGPAASGHMALDRLLRSPDVDIICSPVSYLERGAGGLSGFMAPVDSVRAAGKLYISEDDTRTMHTRPDTPFAAVTGTRNLEETHWEHRRNFGRLMPRRMGAWYMDLIAEGWLNDPGIWDEIARLRAQYEAAMNEPARFAPQVAVVVDERSAAYLAADHALTRPLLSVFRREWYRIGTDFRVHLLSDVVEGRIKLPEVTFFIGCWRVTDSERDILHTALNGRTAVWFHGSGYQSDTAAGPGRIAALIGMPVAETEAGDGRFSFEAAHPLNAGFGGVTAGGRGPVLRPRWHVIAEARTTPLARYVDDGTTAVAMRSFPRWRSIYIGGATCPPQFLRNILHLAGVHVYLDSDGVVSTDGAFLSVSVSGAGEQTLTLPPETSIERLNGERLPVDADGAVRESFQHGETRHYRLRPAGTGNAARARQPGAG